MILPVHTIMKERKKEKWVMMKIGVGSAVTAKIGEMEEKTMEGRSRRMRGEVVDCVRAVVGKKKF